MKKFQDVTKSPNFVTGLRIIKNVVVAFTGVHAIKNAWIYSEGNLLFFILIAGGALCAEIMLWQTYRGITEDELYTSLKFPTIASGATAFVLLALGVVGGHNGWSIYFSYVMPVAPLIMLACTVWIIMSDPAKKMRAERAEMNAVYHMEVLRERIQERRREIDMRRANNKLIQIGFYRKMNRAVAYARSIFRMRAIKREGVAVYSLADEVSSRLLIDGMRGRLGRLSKGAGKRSVDRSDPGGDGLPGELQSPRVSVGGRGKKRRS